MLNIQKNQRSVKPQAIVRRCSAANRGLTVIRRISALQLEGFCGDNCKAHACGTKLGV